MKKLMILLALFVSFITLSACSSSSQSITVLTSSGYEPYQMVNEAGELIGFDIDLMEAIADYLDWEIVWQDVDFDGIIASLQAGQAPLAIAGITPTPERAQMVDFSDIYFSSEAGLQNFLVFSSSSPLSGLGDLSGKVIGAQLGTIQAELLNSLADEYNFTVDLRNQNAQIVEEIQNGRIDALVVEAVVADAILANNTQLSSSLLDADISNIFGNAIAIGKNTGYLEPINEAIAALLEDGTLQTLIDKWFGE
jgi:polar amino acid transport system substrate-binding protein